MVSFSAIARTPLAVLCLVFVAIYSAHGTVIDQGLSQKCYGGACRMRIGAGPSRGCQAVYGCVM
ncbi:hypothetical protein PTTG_29582 [Puccinia triticina 1-1 BBBD Race 1]|uniref:Uncharacterized protein n=1 Tax=Puccinia triticina (isolate 1-1 / race 1 (BBBD)) TaxID=630390 RepID=A0A180G307_PUCT1|nr:hypothetical protein PTTG_29582 [Puccinia triticina 1-1 BBBD Race 1]